MRENMGLYRGKRIYGGRWVEGDLVTPNEIFAGCYIAHIDYLNEHGEVGVISDEVDPNTVGECTGLRDKNGKLIFEGDVLRREQNKKSEVVHTVKYHELYGMWCVSSKVRGQESMSLLAPACDSYEVIGTVHDAKGGEGDG